MLGYISTYNKAGYWLSTFRYAALRDNTKREFTHLWLEFYKHHKLMGTRFQQALQVLMTGVRRWKLIGKSQHSP
ncbi:hypothetical protein KCP71_10585 [Salmonella enterica subsp. enterica]|nr:hypothetical protein KCP71_10585 [Salmonella enterica subsp. enterica]